MSSYLTNGNFNCCCCCGGCEQKCPQKCITFEEKNGFKYPLVNKSLCIDCGLCERVCQYSDENQSKFRKNKALNTFAAWNKNSEKVQKSASGGIFFSVAEKIISCGGIVFGAEYSNDFSVEIVSAFTIEACIPFRKSKYVFSNIGKAYVQAEAFLKEGREVLFTGTPCQIAGLYSFLNRDYEKLFTMDIICHGFSAPVMLKSFLEMMEKKYDNKVKSIDFRHKYSGKCEPILKIIFENGIIHEEPYRKSSYELLYSSNAALMTSCTSCKYVGIERIGDLTIGDFWGIEKYNPEAYNVDGTSLVMVNTEKGQRVFDSIKNELVFYSSDINTAVRHNSPLLRPSLKNPFHKTIIRSLNKCGFKKTFNKYKYFYSKIFLFYRLFRKIKNKMLISKKSALL